MLSAIHTYMYKWSSIFCELGLQCLLSTTPLLKFFLEQFTLEDFPKDSLTTYFYQLVRKIWSGQFSIVYPRDFKNALGLFHVQFQDYRQVCFFLLRFLNGIAFIADRFSLKINMCKACTGSSLLKQNKGVVCLNYLIEEPQYCCL